MIQYLKKAEGSKFSAMSRWNNLVRVSFGGWIVEKNLQGKNEEYSKYNLHIQCPFKLLENEKVIIGSDDLYISNSDQEEVDLWKNNVCMFDEYLQRIDDIKDQIKSVELNQYGDLIIKMDKHTLIVFIDSTNKHEQWRFFEHGKKHLVCYSKKKKYE